MTPFDRVLADYDDRLPHEASVCRVCDTDLDSLEEGGGCRTCALEDGGLEDRCLEDFNCSCPACLSEAEEDEAAAVPLAIVGSIATILLWLFLSAPASSAEAFSARGSGEAGAFTIASPA